MEQSFVCDVQIQSSLIGVQIALPRNLMTKWSLRPGSRIHVKISTCSIPATIRQTQSEHVLFSKKLGQTLRFLGGKISAKKSANRIELGPVVALYVVGNPSNKPPFPNMTRMIADTIRLGEEIGVYVYAVIPGGISVNERIVYGARGTYENWIWKEQPFPDVLIRKAVAFPKHVYNRAKMDLAMLEQTADVKVLAKDIGDKWTIHNLLWNENKLRSHLPYTERLTQKKQVIDLFEKYGALYVKPLRGTQGNGIYKLSESKESASMIILESAASKQDTKRVKRSDLLKHVQSWPFFKQPYLLQQSLKLVQYQNRLTDFRFVVQKLPSQEWVVTARICRIGKMRTITTNIHKGGQAITAEQCLDANQSLFSKTTQEILNEMDDVSLKIAKTINTMNDGVLELGVDLGVDRNGKVWIIEVNPRPGRKMLRLCQPEIRQLSLLRPLEYAKYAKGF